MAKIISPAPGAGRGPARPVVSPALLAALAGRLTARDRWLLRMLLEHPVIPSVEPRLDGAGRSGSPGGRYERGQPTAWREQNGEEPADRDKRQSGARIIGQNGRRSAKRAVMRTARSTWTLSAICTWTLPRIDPQ